MEQRILRHVTSLKSFILGAITGLSQWGWPFFKLLPFIVIPFFLGITDHMRRRQAQKPIFWFGFGYFLVSLYWISIALTVDSGTFAWLIPFALIGIPAVLALFFLGTSQFFPWTSAGGVAKFFLFVGAWESAEIFRAYLFTGFPWALLGYLWLDYIAFAQSAYYITVYGLSAITVGISAGFYLAWKNSLKSFFIAIVIFSLGIGGVGMWGQHRLQVSSLELPPMRLVQPNIAQKLKWDAQHIYQNFQTLIKLSIQPGLSEKQILIWPEAALTYCVTPDLLKTIDAWLPKETILITGALRHEKNDETRQWRSYNSIMIFQKGQGVIAHYDKKHLVPFGEYIPFRAFLETVFSGKLQKITHGLEDFLPGTQRQFMKLPGGEAFFPLICYEIIFPKQLGIEQRSIPQRAWILNLTNDGWFGDTAGPNQHLMMAQMRAIEEGLPVVRVANTGVTAVIDAQGRVQHRIPYNHQGVIDLSRQTKL